MELYGASSSSSSAKARVSAGPGIETPSDWNSRHETTGLEDEMWRMSLQGNKIAHEGSYPERPGESDCPYYMRMGTCGFGSNCRFNHPPGRNLAASTARNRGEEYPDRPGQQECQYFLKTGSCKYGSTCKYHHPQYKAGTATQVALNALGYPLNPNEKECSYYIKTGRCKYGTTCKFHHPPLGASVAMPGSPFYPSIPALHMPGPQPYVGGLPAWPFSRTSLMPPPYMQGPSGIMPVMFSQGMLPVPGWSSYPWPPMEAGPIASPDALHHGPGTGLFYGPRPQMDLMNPGIQSTLSSYSSGPLAIEFPSISAQVENVFPERLGQSDCQFYMRTGTCKFGTTCKYHHPRDRNVSLTSCALSPIGLPLRPGASTCSFYAQKGICKFGPTCKFDHPMGTLSYSPSASSLSDMPVAPYPVGSSSTALAPPSTSTELRTEAARRLSKESNSTSEVPLLTSASEALSSGAQIALSSSSVGSTFSEIGQN
uniref:C3H1-type domain-containing protein n=1 Tax=Araucaria cunninghamii TaxID=56994 RepID=A0A0D6QVW3_ARACU